MTIGVNVVNDEIRTLADSYTLPHGIFLNSLQDINLNIYIHNSCKFENSKFAGYKPKYIVYDNDFLSKRDKDKKVPTVKNSIKDVLSDVVLENFDGDNLSLDASILVVLYCLKKYAFEELGFKGLLWIKTDSSLHRLI
ncbi:MAG: hypothetical protein ACOZCL_05310 [Bacillota bacterium]